MIKLSASSIFRYLICPAAMNHEQGFVAKEESKYAFEGTKKHEEMQKTLEGKPEDFDKNTHVRALNLELDRLNIKLHRIISEEKIERIFENFVLAGTPDFIGLYRESGTLKLIVVDYKFGYMLVLAKNNAQLYAYILLTRFKEAKASIFQNDLLDTIDISEEDLEKFRIRLELAVVQAKQNIYKPDPIACKWCRHRPDCKALANEVKKTTKLIDEKANVSMSDEEKFEYQKVLILNKKFFEFALEDAESFFKNSLQKGGFYDFIELKSNGSMKSWSKELSEGEILQSLVEISGKNKSDFVDTKLKSVAQIQNLIPEIPEHFIESREKAKSLKLKGAVSDKNLTQELF